LIEGLWKNPTSNRYDKIDDQENSSMTINI
jgi:hypothetical protein